jgi:hypothetical protein
MHFMHLSSERAPQSHGRAIPDFIANSDTEAEEPI